MRKKEEGYAGRTRKRPVERHCPPCLKVGKDQGKKGGVNAPSRQGNPTNDIRENAATVLGKNGSKECSGGLGSVCMVRK